MRAIVAVTFCDTPENHRSGATLRTLRTLAERLDERHIIAPVDNGSTDLTAWEWLQGQPRFKPIRVAEPHSIAQGVNTAWNLFHEALVYGSMVAVKHDSDTDVEVGWLERIIEIMEREPRVGLMGPYLYLRRNDPRGPDRWGWWKTSFVNGAVSVRSPAAFRAIGYARNPHGRYGNQDHWDVFRVHKAGLICGLVDVMAKCHFGSGVFTREQVKKMLPQARTALAELQAEVRAGKRGLYEPYEGIWE